MSEVVEPVYQYARVAEGFCPDVSHGRLDREALEGSGWCDDCGLGWAVSGDEVSIHLVPRFNDEAPPPSRS